MPTAAALPVTPDDLAELRRWARSAQLPAVLVRRARILLVAADGAANTEIAQRVGVSRPTVIARAYPRRQLHLVCDNYATHKHPTVRGWLASHPRIHLHFTPTSASWLNLVEVFFSIVERQALRRGDFTSVTDLITAISRFCAAWNQRCQPFSWTNPADESGSTPPNVVSGPRSLAVR
jgi:transposase